MPVRRDHSHRSEAAALLAPQTRMQILPEAALPLSVPHMLTHVRISGDGRGTLREMKPYSMEHCEQLLRDAPAGCERLFLISQEQLRARKIPPNVTRKSREEIAAARREVMVRYWARKRQQESDLGRVVVGPDVLHEVAPD